MSQLRGLGDCRLAFGDNPDRRCAWCGTPLAGRRRRWCRDECELDFRRNHDWGSDRNAALGRDGHRCRRCGASWAEVEAWRAFVLAVTAPTPDDRREALDIAWRWRLEVNHVEPIRGRHGTFGCHHHLDGLETLCRPCHLDETARQFGHRRPQRERLPL